MKKLIVFFMLTAISVLLYCRVKEIVEIKVKVPDVTASERADLYDMIGFVSNMEKFLKNSKDEGAQALYIEKAGINLTNVIKRSDPSLKLLQLRKKILNREFGSLPEIIVFGEKEDLSLFFSMKNRNVKYYIFKIAGKESENDKKLSSSTNRIASECLSSLKTRDGIKPLKSRIMSAKVISSGSEDLFFHYMSENQDKEPVMNLVIFSNLARSFFDMSIKRRGESIFDKKTADTVTYKSFMLLCKLQFTGRLFGPVIIEKAKDKVLSVADALGSDFAKIIELKAFSSALTGLDVIKNDGLINEHRRRSVYATYIALLVNNSGYGSSSPAGESALIQLNYFFRKGGIFFNLNKKKLSLNFPKVFSVAKSLVKSSVRFLSKGSAGSFMTNYSRKSPGIDKIPGYKSDSSLLYKIKYEPDIRK